METIENKQLSAELQELYLQNKEWQSDVSFLEDEIRFFKKLFDKVITLAIHEQRVEELHPVNQGLAGLSKKRQVLKQLIFKHQQLIASLIKDQTAPTSIALIEENTRIIEDIKALFLEEKKVRKDLFELTEKVFDAENKSHLLTQ